MDSLVTTLILSIAILVILPFLLYGLATMDLFFTLISSNEIKYIVQSDGSLVRIIHDVKNFRLDEKDHLVHMKNSGEKRDEENKKTFLQKRLGLYWVGVPPFRRVHHFEINKQREDPQGDDPKKWLKKEEREDVSSLRFTFPRPYVILNAELKDRLTVNLLVMCKFEVIKPYEPVMVFKGNFFGNIGAILEAAVLDVLKDHTIEELLASLKGENSGILSDLKKEEGKFNEALLFQVGVQLVGISIAKWDPANKEIEAAIAQKAFAEQKGQADILAAEKAATALKISATAQREAENLLTEARANRIRQTVATLTLPGSDQTAVSTAAANLLRAEAVSGKDSKITTWVDGSSGTGIVVPTSQEKK